MTVSADDLFQLLNEALNLSVRAKRLDAIAHRETMLGASADPDEWLKSGQFDRYVARHNADCLPRKEIETRSLTLQLWVVDAFDRDMHDWEQRARKACQTWEAEHG